MAFVLEPKKFEDFQKGLSSLQNYMTQTYGPNGANSLPDLFKAAGLDLNEVQPSALQFSPNPVLTPPLEHGPMGLGQSLVRSVQTTPTQREQQARSDVFQAKGASRILPEWGPRITEAIGGPQFQRIQPTNLSESLLYGGTSALAELPAIIGASRLVGGLTPGLSTGGGIAKTFQSALTGGVYEGGKATVGGRWGDILPDIAKGAGTFAAFHAGGEIGGNVLSSLPKLSTKLLPTKLLTKISPQIAETVTNVTKTTGSAVGGALAGLSLAQMGNAPDYEKTSQAILGAAIGLMGSKAGAKDALIRAADKVLIERKIKAIDRLQDDARTSEIMDLWNVAKSFREIDPEFAARYEQAAIDRGLREIVPPALHGPAKPIAFEGQAKQLPYQPIVEGPETLRTLAPKDIDTKTRRTRGPGFIMYPKNSVGASLAGEQIEKISALNDAIKEPVILQNLKDTANVPAEIRQDNAIFEQNKQTNPEAASQAQVEVDKKSSLVSPEIKQEIERDMANPKLDTNINLYVKELFRNLIGKLGGGDPTQGSFSRFIFDITKGYIDKKVASTELKNRFFTELKALGFVPIKSAGFFRSWFKGEHYIEKGFLKRFSYWFHQEDPFFRDVSKKYWDSEAKAGRPLRQFEIDKFNKIADIMKKYTQPLLDEVNAYRRTIGQTEIKEIAKYSPFLEAFETSLDFTSKGVWQDAIKLMSKILDGEAGGSPVISEGAPPRQAGFQHTARYKTPDALMDPFTSLEKYFEHVEHFKQNAPLIQRANYFADIAEGIAGKFEALWKTGNDKLSPEDVAWKTQMMEAGKTPQSYQVLADNFRKISESIAGKNQGGGIDAWLTNDRMGRVINKIQQTWMGQMVTTFSVGMTQLLSLVPLAGSEVGMGRAWGSLADVFAKEVIRMVKNPEMSLFPESLTKQARDVNHLEGKFTNVPNNLARFVGRFAEFMDTFMVKVAYNAGYRYYMEKMRPGGMTMEDAIPRAQRYGDYLSARTQAMFIKSMKPLLLQNIVMSHIIPFQNSILAGFNTMAGEGLLAKNLSLDQKTTRLAGAYATAVILTYAINSLKQSPGNIWEEAILQIIPVVGSMTRFGGTSAGYMGEIQRMLISPTKENVVRGIVNIGGPVGSSQVVRTAGGLASMIKGEALSRSAVPMDASNPFEWLRAATVGYRATKEYANYVAERQSSKGPIERFNEYFFGVS